MTKAAILFADGLEEIEGLTVVDVLRRAGITADILSVNGSDTVTGSHGILIGTDHRLEGVAIDDYDVLVLPGGMPGTANLEASQDVIRAVKAFDAQKKHIAAICAAPGILGRLGLLSGKTACCFPGVEEALEGANVTTAKAVTDGHITTGRSMGCAVPFALEVLRLMKGEDAAKEMAKTIVFSETAS